MEPTLIYAQAREAQAKGDFARAAMLQEAVSQVYITQGDFDRAATVLANAARCYLERGQGPDAERAAGEAVLLSLSASMPRVQALAHEVSVECAYERHDFATAEARLRTRLSLWGGIGVSSELVQGWIRLANTLQWQGKLDEAVRAAAEAASLVAADPRRQESFAKVLGVLEDWHWRHAWARQQTPITFAFIELADRRALSLWHHGRRLVLYRTHPGLYTTDSVEELEGNRHLWDSLREPLGEGLRPAVGFRLQRLADQTDDEARYRSWRLDGEYPPSVAGYSSFIIEVLSDEGPWNEGLARIRLA